MPISEAPPGQLTFGQAAAMLLRELKDIQAMLAAPAANSPRIGAAAAGPPPRPAATCSDEDEAAPLPLPAAPRSPGKHMRELERQAAVLRQEAAEANDRCRALEEALQAARHDGLLAVAKLHTQLAAKAEEASGLGWRGWKRWHESFGQLGCQTKAACLALHPVPAALPARPLNHCFTQLLPPPTYSPHNADPPAG